MITHRRREPAPDVLRLVLPLPFPGLDRVNAFLLPDHDGATLVDCGIRTPDPDKDHGWEHLVDAFAAAEMSPRDVARLVVTHPHIDHYGLAARLVEETGCELWMHRASDHDLELYRHPEAAAHELEQLLTEHGVDPSDLDALTAFEDWRSFISGVVEADPALEGGEVFTAAGRQWRVVYTPGHSPSHVCLWAEEEGLLVSGDHLLGTITPHIDARHSEEDDPLGDFLQSLQTIEKLAPALVLPGHGHPFEDGADRARVVARHHDRRLGGILQVIRTEPRTANEITDEIFGTTLLHFERRLALGEALAHLVYLRHRGEIERVEMDDGTTAYRKVRRTWPRDDGA